MKCLEEGKCRYIDIDAFTSSGNTSYSVDANVLLGIIFILLDLDKLEKEFGNIIEEFKPELFVNLRKCLIDMFKTIIDYAIDSKEIEINLTMFNKVDDIGLWIFNKILGQDKLKSCVVKLMEFETSLENFRENLLTTSYA